MSPTAFVSPLPLTRPSRSSSLSARRPAKPPLPGVPACPAIPPPARTRAVLDTPASNTYLQRHAEVAVRDFLTRRAVNTVMYYMQELGDSPSCNWLSQFDDFQVKVDARKFTDADAYLDRMLHAPREKGTLKVSHPIARFSRTYHFSIEPRRIAEQVFAARTQLAAEWSDDLNCIRLENVELQRMAFEKMLCSDEKHLASKRNLIFDVDPFTTDHSPLRYRNYVALKTLTMQHAVARLLPYLRDQGSNHDYMYLLAFVKAHGVLTDGDAFVKDLMARPVEKRTHPDHVIQPRALALQVLELRVVIAEEWIAVMDYIPEEAIVRRRRGLERALMLVDPPGEDVRKPTEGHVPTEGEQEQDDGKHI